MFLSYIQNAPAAEMTENGTSDTTAPEVPPSENAEAIAAFGALVGIEDTEQLLTLLRRIEAKEENVTDPVLLAPDSDKAHRAAS
jgi:hypothetical protein